LAAHSWQKKQLAVRKKKKSAAFGSQPAINLNTFDFYINPLPVKQ
jgi:hypothetical protein